jgi:putative glutamine amidotransferase
MASRPHIGITAEFRREEREKSVIASAYYDAVAAAGGLPLVLPPVASEEPMDELLDALDGLLLTGGRDYDPAHFGGPPDDSIRPIHPRRQTFDLLLAKKAVTREIPTLGICAGAQLIAIVCGGDLEMDLPRDLPGTIDHGERAGRPVFHDIDVSPGSLLAEAVGVRTMRVNSMHHQAVRDPGRGLRASGRSPDGVVEAIESDGPFLLGVQWHPELLPSFEAHRRLFEALVSASRRE